MGYKAIKFFGIAALLLLPFLAGAQQPQSEEEELKQLREVIDKTVAAYETQLRLELKALREAKVSNADIYQTTQDKWAEQIYNALQKVFDEDQWAKYLKSGAARDKKARDKRAAKRK